MFSFLKKILKKKTCILVNNCDKMNQLEEENKALKKKVDKLNITLAKFTLGYKILETIPNSQICVFNKKGLGYQPKKNKKYLKYFFVKAKQSYNPNQTCNYCRNIGHLIYTSPIKKEKVSNIIWVPKETTTNHKGLKKGTKNLILILYV
jgi:hypothetical protein